MEALHRPTGSFRWMETVALQTVLHSRFVAVANMGVSVSGGGQSYAVQTTRRWRFVFFKHSPLVAVAQVGVSASVWGLRTCSALQDFPCGPDFQVLPPCRRRPDQGR